MTEKKQTAVEWFADEIKKHYIINNGSLNPTVVIELKRQAKAMEEEQKIEYAKIKVEEALKDNSDYEIIKEVLTFKSE